MLFVGSLYQWCCAILCLVSFVDQIIQLKLVGEYYVKSFVKTIAWFAIMCMCHSKGTFSFSVRRRRRRWERRVGGGRVVVCGMEIHQPWEMEIVSKTVFFHTKYGYSKTMTVTVSYLTVTMISDFTVGDSGFPRTVVPTQRTTFMDQRILRFCPNKVSHGSRCKVFLRGW